MTFSMLGILIAQLMRLHHTANPRSTLGYFAVSVPLASVCHITAMTLTVIGCYRFLKYQKTMALGAALSGGWELVVVGLLAFLVRHMAQNSAFATDLAGSIVHICTHSCHRHSQTLSMSPATATSLSSRRVSMCCNFEGLLSNTGFQCAKCSKGSFRVKVVDGGEAPVPKCSMDLSGLRAGRLINSF